MNPWLIIIWLATLGAAALGGWSMRGDNEDAKRLTAIEQAAEKKDAVQQSVDQSAADQATAAAEQAVQDRIITREVIRYVQVTPAADRCTLPGTWRVRHDAATTGRPAEAAGLADGQAAPITDAAALDTVAENYVACRTYAEQVAGWQAHWEAVKGLCRE